MTRCMVKTMGIYRISAAKYQGGIKNPEAGVPHKIFDFISPNPRIPLSRSDSGIRGYWIKFYSAHIFYTWYAVHRLNVGWFFIKISMISLKYSQAQYESIGVNRRGSIAIEYK